MKFQAMINGWSQTAFCMKATHFTDGEKKEQKNSANMTYMQSVLHNI